MELTWFHTCPLSTGRVSLTPWVRPGPRGAPGVTLLPTLCLGGVSAPLRAETPSLYKETIIHSLIHVFEFYCHNYFLSTYSVPGTV